MKLKTKFLLLFLVVHLILFLLAAMTLKDHDKLFLFVEIAVLLSGFLTFWVYQGVSQAIDTMSSSIKSIDNRDFNTRLVKVGHPEVDDVIAIYNRMIDCLREERIKHEEKNQVLVKLIDSSPSGIVILNNDNTINSINASALRMLKQSSRGTTNTRLADFPGILANKLQVLRDGIPEVVAVDGLHMFKCQKAHFMDQGFSHFFIMIEELTDEIYIKEKAAYEKVISIMSHEVNNSIGAINSILQTIVDHNDQLHPDFPADYEYALNVAINRNKGLTNVMSNFAKVVNVAEPNRQQVHIHEVLRSVHQLMHPSTRIKNIEWIWSLVDADPSVLIDVEQFEQVLINVLKNAIEAILETGKIKIKTSVNPVTITISDNGEGIPSELSANLFSPFFSTKASGQGIGLTIIREILTKHNFQFTLGTKDGWTEFQIILNA